MPPSGPTSGDSWRSPRSTLQHSTLASSRRVDSRPNVFSEISHAAGPSWRNSSDPFGSTLHRALSPHHGPQVFGSPAKRRGDGIGGAPRPRLSSPLPPATPLQPLNVGRSTAGSSGALGRLDDTLMRGAPTQVRTASPRPHYFGSGNAASILQVPSVTSSPRPTSAQLPPTIRHGSRHPPRSPPSLQETLSLVPLHLDKVTHMALQSSPRPAVSRRSSSNSLASLGGHSMTHSRRTSQTLTSVHSPGSAAMRPSVYRPPHLRNQSSSHALRRAVAHYDRVRTPSLRGQTRSRESSVSAHSHGGSRPPSAVPFLSANSIAEDSTSIDSDTEADLNSARTQPRQSVSNTPPRHSPFSDQTHAQPKAQILEGSLAPDAQEADPSVESVKRLLDLRSRLSLNDSHCDGSAEDLEPDDQGGDFSLEEMMADSLTDNYCLSRSASCVGEVSAVDIFEIGDRLGPGLMHDGYPIRIAETSHGFLDQSEDISGSQLEVERQLGQGSYAVVYLVREVLADRRGRDLDVTSGEKLSGQFAGTQSRNGAIVDSASVEDADQTVPAEDEGLSSTLKASTVMPSASRLSFSARAAQEADTPPREFALKCLCKRDLSEEMLEVQRLEATIHQSIPRHQNIVTLYRTYETPEWLFLVLEYCPGQDMFYWLEQAHDTADSKSLYSALSSPYADGESSEDLFDDIQGPESSREENSDSTPPSPSLLASTSIGALLSRKRLRLIARMFAQMCDAVQFCHDHGISHRDLKPENFIVEDRRQATDEKITDQRALTVGKSLDGTVTVKLTDFGLATAEETCHDFECGSKPYMAFEVLNNITDSYDPKQADIWSLGVVLLNLLFHRSPFKEPSAEHCDSFASYCCDPIKFLTESFEGLTTTVAVFFSEHVLCEVSSASNRKRISAAEFGRWAKGLPEMLLEDGSPCRVLSRGASLESTTPLIHSRAPSLSPFFDHYGRPHSSNGDVSVRTSHILPSPLSSYLRHSFDDTSSSREGSPSISSLSRFPPGDSASSVPLFPHSTEPLSPKTAIVDLPPVEEMASTTETTFQQMVQSEHADADATQSRYADDGATHTADTPVGADLRSSVDAVTSLAAINKGADVLEAPQIMFASSSPKRRKRGARKGRSTARQDGKSLNELLAPLVPGNPLTESERSSPPSLTDHLTGASTSSRHTSLASISEHVGQPHGYGKANNQSSDDSPVWVSHQHEGHEASSFARLPSSSNVTRVGSSEAVGESTGKAPSTSGLGKLLRSVRPLV